MAVPLQKIDEVDVIVFDLDYTLWPFWVDTHVDPPFEKKGEYKVVDRHGKKVTFYADVPQVLLQLKAAGYQLAVASRTSERDGAEQLLRLFDWDRHFDCKQIYPGCKITHFRKIERHFQKPFHRMMFFDDERRNIQDLSPLGVHCVYVEGGVSMQMVRRALDDLSNRGD